MPFDSKPTPKRKSLHPAGGESRTRQSSADEMEINNIIRRYIRTGTAPVTGATPTYGDFSSALSYHEALSRVRQAQADFMELPAEVRKVADNDPGKFVELLADPEQLQRMIDQGLPDDRIPPRADVPTEPAAPEEPATPSE